MPISQILSPVLILTLLTTVSSYIDITLPIASSSSDIAFNLPMTVGGNKMPLAISLENKDEFLVVTKKGKSSKGKGELKVSSL